MYLNDDNKLLLNIVEEKKKKRIGPVPVFHLYENVARTDGAYDGTTICCYSNKLPFLSKEKKYRRRTMSGTLLSHLNRLPPPSVVFTCIFHEKKIKTFFVLFKEIHLEEEWRHLILDSFLFRLLSIVIIQLFQTLWTIQMADTHRKKGGVTSLRVGRVPCHRQRVCIITLNKQGAALALKKKKHFFFGPLLVAHALTNPNSLVPFFVLFFFSIISSWLYISYSKTKPRETIIDTPASYIYNINIRGVSIFLLPILFFYDNILINFDDVIFDTDKCFPFPFFFILPSIVLLEIHFHISSRDKPDSFITNNGRVQRELQKILKIRKRNILSEMTFTGLQMILRVYQLRSGELS